jgi:argininosuccinate lyase
MTKPKDPNTTTTEKPMWDRGDPIDREMLAFTVGDDWRMDQRLVPHELLGSRVHAEALLRAGILDPEDGRRILAGLEELERAHRAGEWTVEEGDEDVHSALERRLIALVGEAGKRLHTGRSRNEQVALDVLLWLREASAGSERLLTELGEACTAFERVHGALAVPGYTHLRRAMPSTLGAWIGAHRRAFELDREELVNARRRAAHCPLGSGAGYGVPLALDRAFEARALGFDAPVEPVTAVQHARGRAELAYLTALESLALDLGKLAADVWLFTSEEFGFFALAPEFTTGSSLMPQKRNPDAIELTRARTSPRARRSATCCATSPPATTATSSSSRRRSSAPTIRPRRCSRSGGVCCPPCAPTRTGSPPPPPTRTCARPSACSRP